MRDYKIDLLNNGKGKNSKKNELKRKSFGYQILGFGSGGGGIRPIEVDYLLIAGGGGGGLSNGGGGGAGGMRSSFPGGTKISLAEINNTITVGTGGDGTVSPWTGPGGPGVDSTIVTSTGNLSSTGGGRGAAGAPVPPQADGGSGGGGGHQGYGGVGNVGGYTPVEGYDGGSGGQGNYNGSGGGGAGAVGVNNTGGTSGPGSAGGAGADPGTPGTDGLGAGGGGNIRPHSVPAGGDGGDGQIILRIPAAEAAFYPALGVSPATNTLAPEGSDQLATFTVTGTLDLA